MPWLGWTKDEKSGEEVNTKLEKTSSGDSNVHYLRSSDGDRQDHSHVVYSKHADGSRSAHGYPPKSKR